MYLRSVKHYVYIHIRKDNNSPFYIGKGTSDSRHNLPYHRAYSKKRRNEAWYQITSETEFLVEIVFSSDDEKEAFKKERELIDQYGRSRFGTGVLCNIGAGGGGGASIPHLPEWSRSRFKACHRYSLNGDYIDSFESYHDASRKLGLDRSALGSCIRGRNKTCGGFIWKATKS